MGRSPLVAAIYMTVFGCANLAVAHQACTLKHFAWVRSHFGESRARIPHVQRILVPCSMVELLDGDCAHLVDGLHGDVRHSVDGVDSHLHHRLQCLCRVCACAHLHRRDTVVSLNVQDGKRHMGAM